MLPLRYIIFGKVGVPHQFFFVVVVVFLKISQDEAGTINKRKIDSPYSLLSQC